MHVRGTFLFGSAAGTSPADKATITVAEFKETFLGSAAIEANSKETYDRHLTLHVAPYIGQQRVAEVSRETVFNLFMMALKEEGATQSTILHTRTALSSMFQMAWDHGYRRDNPVRGIRLKGVPTKSIVVVTRDQFFASSTCSRTSPRRYLPVLGSRRGRGCAS